MTIYFNKKSCSRRSLIEVDNVGLRATTLGDELHALDNKTSVVKIVFNGNCLLMPFIFGSLLL